MSDIRALPALAPATRTARVFWFAGIATAIALLGMLAGRMIADAQLWHWSTLLVALCGVVTADFLSGIVHWAADTWGRDDTPVVGQRILVPFRVHHVNPDDFLRRRFLDTNGDVAWVTSPVLLSLQAVPLETMWGSLAAVFGFTLCGTGVMTNQIHQWAHMASPPWPVRVLQDCGVLLGRREHGGHHAGAYDSYYCITTGWCNRPLDRMGFFRRLERVITQMTRMQPRAGDHRYALAAPSAPTFPPSL
jgi:plasmanylethanolamine desaturase